MFKNAKIVGMGADSSHYHDLIAARGSLAYPMSSSALRSVFAKCPRAWRDGWTLAGSDSLEYGSLVDTLALTPELFEARYSIQPKTYMADPTKKGEAKTEKPWNNNATACKEWRHKQQDDGKSIVSTSELAEAMMAVERMMNDKNIKSFFDGSDKQVWVVGEWHDDATGLIVPVQCLIDLVEREVPLTRQRIGDLKTTKNAAIMPWARWARFAGYDVQAAWNMDLFNAATGRDIRIFEFVLSESEYPFTSARRLAIDPATGDPESDEGSAIVSGRRQYRRMMADYCQCLKHDIWPGYDDTDESSGGATELRADPYEEQRRMFAPKFSFEEQQTETEELEITMLN